jgi:hypothetical protein
MSQRFKLALAVIALLGGLLAAPIEAQSVSDPLKACEIQTKNFDAWSDCVINTVVTQVTLQANQRHAAKQVELPSIAENTTSLVDQTSAPDIVGLALNLSGLKSNSAASNNGASGAITTSAYALFAGIQQRDPLDPAFYNLHPDLRRFSFNVGQDAGDQAIPNSAARLFGFKILILNGREVSRSNNRKRLMAVSNALREAGPGLLTIKSDLQDYLLKVLGTALALCNKTPRDAGAPPVITFAETCLEGSELATTIMRLTGKQRQEIAEKIVLERVTSNGTNNPLVKLNQTTAEIVERIRRAPQLSFSFDSKLRNGTGVDEYRTGVLFDYGVYERLNLTLNGTFDYKDSKSIGGDTRAGRFAAEGIFQLTPNKSSFGDPRPWLLSTSAEAKWPNDHKNTYTGQVKLTIPIPGLTGVNFPISVSVANRSDLIKEKTVRGKFGFTVDITKLLSKAP